MRRRTSSSAVLALTLIGCAFAATPATAQTSTGTADAGLVPANPTAVELQVELNALNTMTDTIGPMVRDAQSRMEQMKAFISEQNLDGALRSFAPTGSSSSFHGLSFHQSFEVALQDQRLRGTPTPISSDVGQMENDVVATQGLVQPQWSRLNSLHAEVAKMSAFLHAQGKLNAYAAWSKTPAAKRLSSHEPPPPTMDQAASDPSISPQQRAANIQKYQQQQAALRHHWDQYHFSGAPPAWTPRPYVQNPANPPASGSVGQSADADQYVTDDYYGGTYWNGYADPYYDVWGHPAVNGAAARFAGANDWERGQGSVPAVAPAMGHPSMGARR
ncbi:MAG: hypothetical protein KDA22_06075 [Phycisphaerales bacterium]|nr:hypothetical protein [Phycisphaerales bacterium]